MSPQQFPRAADFTFATKVPKFVFLAVVFGARAGMCYLEKAALLAGELLKHPPWAMWLLLDAGLPLTAREAVARIPNVHIIIIGNDTSVHQQPKTRSTRAAAGIVRMNTNLTATLARFVLLDDPGICVGLVVDTDAHAGKAVRGALALARHAMGHAASLEDQGHSPRFAITAVTQNIPYSILLCRFA